MSMSSSCATNRRHKKIVGTSVTFDNPKVPSGRVETMIFKVNGFSDRAEPRGRAFNTSALSAHGRQWNLLIFPRGDAHSDEDTEYISIYLNKIGSEPITADYTLICGSMESSATKHTFTERFPCWGYSNWIRRSVFINRQNGYMNENGGTTFEISLQLYVDKRSVWYPGRCNEGWVPAQLFKCEASKDVTFEVQGSEFRVHSSVLELCAPVLFEMVEDKSLLVAADNFGCTDLKLYVESTLTEHFLTADTAASLLALADVHSCALLKEAAMLLYMKDPEAVKDSKDWTLALKSTSILAELLDTATLGTADITIDSSKHLTAEEIEMLDVTSLRERLEKANLDLDGSRETLVKRLITYVDTTTNESDGGSDDDDQISIKSKISV
ncbi:BTB/POZ domain containing protein [Nitzschia inconspicua]|uniref:BTB/POZ domain containing protein n=1 Tax=Nitzschia inconspicua TaxID=303405 RepID=A0A9K3PEV2_9STRA|nr:BTB/POZ domain containing protein [Nitzschia inconspicua]